MRIVIVTGLSGAGKSTALRALEDIEFYCVDNIPVPLVSQLLTSLREGGEVQQVAIAIDSRQEPYLGSFKGQIDALIGAGYDVEILFLEASEEHLLRRFKETRRRHPLAGDDLLRGIRRDRELMSGLHEGAAVVDTTSLNVHQLKGIIQERYGFREGSLAITLLSFGFKHGLPPESDLVFDVRYLPNPYFDAELSGSDGRNPRVAEYVFESQEGQGRELTARLFDLLGFTLPLYEREGKRYLTIAIGCTGGRHRSVALVEELKRRLSPTWDVLVRHRDLDRGSNV
ncbi:MAG TPA: RNase adapter RapZ [Kofleriaceae bacterium]|nr:RNase adapter RapZ [Kofleriaceae bacterium]